MKETLDDKILRLTCIVDQINAIAFCTANSSVDPDKGNMMYNNVLYSIENLSEQLRDGLDALSISLGNVGEVVV